MLKLDHLAIAARDLGEGVEWVENALGVSLQPGGTHDYYGTHNRLLGLGDLYLEVIAPVPGVDPGRPRWFGLDEFAGPPCIANWLCRADDLDAALRQLPAQAGEAVDLQRGDLRWRIAVPPDGGLPMEAGLPTVLQWQGARPQNRLSESGCRLRLLEIAHPDAAQIDAMLSGLLDDPRVVIADGPAPHLVATFETPDGLVTL